MRYINKAIEIIFTALFGLFPIKKNRVLFMSYYGKHVNCNPYSLYCKMKQSKDKYELVWVDNSKKMEKSVRYKSVLFYYYLRTSAFLVFNARPNVDIKKRKGQYYIQTWHSSLGFKMIEKDAEETLSRRYVQLAKIDSKYIDLLISGCRFRTKCFQKNFWYDGEIAEIGTPRNDVFFEDSTEQVIRLKRDLGISMDEKILTYAPTFRSNGSADYVFSLDIEKLMTTVKSKFGGNWRLVLRLHPNVASNFVMPQGVVDASKLSDMQMLLLASDILITDYSSVMFDFGILKRPCFLYCPDFDEYLRSERRTYFAHEELPFSLNTSNDGLAKSICSYDEQQYLSQLRLFDEKIGSFENGHACEEIVKWVNDRLKK